MNCMLNTERVFFAVSNAEVSSTDHVGKRSLQGKLNPIGQLNCVLQKEKLKKKPTEPRISDEDSTNQYVRKQQKTGKIMEATATGQKTGKIMKATAIIQAAFMTTEKSALACAEAMALYTRY